MQKKMCLLSISILSLCWCVESAPSSLGSSEYDELDTNLKYDIEEEDFDDFSKLLDEAGKAEDDKIIKTSGFKTKTTSNKGSKKNHRIGDFKKYYEAGGLHDQGANDDEEVYAKAEGFYGTGLGIKGSEDRMYRRGSKTRGFHRVHHKDEYKKDKVFYEDDETRGAVNKVDTKGLGYRIKAGAGFNKGHFHHDRQKGTIGKRGYMDRGFSDKALSDYADSQGFKRSFFN